MTDEVRLRDVAEAAGVSIATASRALTGRNRVSASTTAHVTAVARRLGYQVNSVGRALREGSTRTVGMTVPVIGNPYFAQLVDAVEGALVEPGLELLIADSHGDVDHEARRLRTLVGRQIDGLVVVPADVERSAPALRAARRHAPVVQLDRRVEGLTTDFVGVDNALGMRVVVDHLVDRGARSVVLVGADDVTSAGVERREGFEAAVARRGLEVHAPLLDDFSLEAGQRAAEELVARGPLPDAVVAADDLLAVGVVTTLRRLGVDVPGRVLVTGFDGTVIAGITEPALTTVVQPFAALAQEVTRTLLARIADGSAPTRQSRISPELLVRASTTRP
ncbi:LacI family transcriptional regulator [Cellulomonas iranensis]|uniref:LacI family DNA-binding transcriptional regulator n=1 Tax=Cellulomonas iranensis TaxID=76862 RepID=UPI001CF2279F|nr:LacI family DNA-binding transcriptional regulator [Cellulomonas iranensis]UCN13746.1 LacI family transcriptional regulator [Cellulomonas iranensis]